METAQTRAKKRGHPKAKDEEKEIESNPDKQESTSAGGKRLKRLSSSPQIARKSKSSASQKDDTEDKGTRCAFPGENALDDLARNKESKFKKPADLGGKKQACHACMRST
jgi:hypothetical protein